MPTEAAPRLPISPTKLVPSSCSAVTPSRPSARSVWGWGWLAQTAAYSPTGRSVARSRRASASLALAA